MASPVNRAETNFPASLFPVVNDWAREKGNFKTRSEDCAQYRAREGTTKCSKVTKVKFKLSRTSILFACFVVNFSSPKLRTFFNLSWYLLKACFPREALNLPDQNPQLANLGPPDDA